VDIFLEHLVPRPIPKEHSVVIPGARQLRWWILVSRDAILEQHLGDIGTANEAPSDYRQDAIRDHDCQQRFVGPS
jgi:hypothetical protein